MTIEPTDEMRAAVRRRMGIPDGVELDPWMDAAIGDVLAIVERDRYADVSAIRSALDEVLAAAIPVSGGEVRQHLIGAQKALARFDEKRKGWTP